LLVEGETDKEYFEMLKDPEHGASRLQFDGFIFPYNGRDNLKSRTLVTLIKSRYKRFIITYDLDSDRDLSRILEEMGCQRGKNYFPVGLNMTGKDSIEGLLPDTVLKSVFGTHIDLVQQSQSGTKEIRESAKNKLKKLQLEEFRKVAIPGQEYYGNFYALVKKINAALR
jgi:hypothetical protein